MARNRLAPVAVLGAVGLLTASAAVFGGTAAPSSPSNGQTFADTVLAEATVPPGGRPSQGPHTRQPRWLGGWGATPGTGGIVGAHAFYLYDESPTTVTRYVESHLPPGAVLSGYGTSDGLVSVVTETVPVSGPDEYMADLTYQVAPTQGATGSELRIDAKTAWVPPRPLNELVPAGSSISILVTGFGVLTVARGPSGPVTVTVSGARAQPIIRAFNSLPPGPAAAGCHEDVPYFKLAISPRKGSPATFRATGDACVDDVRVVAHDKPARALSDRGCALLEAVRAVLPKRARATVSAATECAQSHRRRRGLPPPGRSAFNSQRDGAREPGGVTVTTHAPARLLDRAAAGKRRTSPSWSPRRSL